MLQGKLSNLRALWLLRVSSVCIGVILLYALISKGTREPPAGVAIGRGMPFGTDDDVDGLRRHPEMHRDPERLLEEEQLAQDLDGEVDGEVDAENVAMEQEADRDSAFSLAKMARLLGWGKDPEEEEVEEAGADDGDGIGGVVLTGNEHGGVLDEPPAAGPDTDWINNPLLRRFMAEFGSRTDLPDSGDSEVDDLADVDGRGEMGDFTTTTTFAGVLAPQIEPAAVKS